MEKNKIYWQRPKSKGLSASSDLRLFYEVLSIALQQDGITRKQIREELSLRVKGFTHMKDISSTGVNNLIRELKAFKWIYSTHTGSVEKSDLARYLLTPEAHKLLQLCKNDRRIFLFELITKMHNEYVIPGWLVDRLWKVNPKGQGQIVIPSPLKDWNPKSKKWGDFSWSDELKSQTEKTAEIIQKVSPGSFPMPIDYWVEEVKKSWMRLSNITNKENKHLRELGKRYTPRFRLTLAMKEAATKYFFGNKLPQSDKADFENLLNPLVPRSYMAWCPRLEELELIFYTDFHPKIPGRLIFPVSVFKEKKEIVKNYDPIEGIKNLNNEILCLHKPQWKFVRQMHFNETLYKSYRVIYLKNKTLYVSLQDLRDEVCRQLRISSTTFDEFITKTVIESLQKNIKYIISLETDVREDQRSGFQVLRRPVLFNGKPFSLIAITN